MNTTLILLAVIIALGIYLERNPMTEDFRIMPEGWVEPAEKSNGYRHWWKVKHCPHMNLWNKELLHQRKITRRRQPIIKNWTNVILV
jgi:hypothetical protein